MNYNPIDTCYNKAIELEGVIATIGENQTKVLIRETSQNNTYGIDYKKIISSTSIQQGNYVFINGVEYLIVDMEEQLSQSIYNVGIFRKTLSILLGDNYKPVQAIVDRNKVSILSTQGIQAEYDQYNFIIPKLGNNVALNNEIVWEGAIYTAISVDTTKYGLYYVTGKYKDTYVPHSYTITLSDTSKTLKETETYQIVTNCMDNGSVVTNPIITYTSSDPNIVSVDSTGVVTGTLVGSAIITCTFKNVSVDLTITVEEKPVEPVVSYTYNFSQGASIRRFVTSLLTTTKTVNGVADSTLHIDYSFDTNAQALISAGKIEVMRKSDSSITIRNVSVNTSTNIYLTVIDSANGTKILDAYQITLTGM